MITPKVGLSTFYRGQLLYLYKIDERQTYVWYTSKINVHIPRRWPLEDLLCQGEASSDKKQERADLVIGYLELRSNGKERKEDDRWVMVVDWIWMGLYRKGSPHSPATLCNYACLAIRWKAVDPRQVKDLENSTVLLTITHRRVRYEKKPVNCHYCLVRWRVMEVYM